jgi:guanine deaminase
VSTGVERPGRRHDGQPVVVAGIAQFHLAEARVDFGGGDEWLIPRVLGDAFKVHITEPDDAGVSMHPAEMLFVGTLAGARALDMEDRFGNFDVGKEADFVVVDPAGTPTLAAALAHGVRSRDPDLARDQTLFALLMGMRESSIAQVYVQGRRLDPGGSS